MGMMSTEQTVRVIEAVGDVVKTKPMPQQQENYLWLFIIAVAGSITSVLLGYYLNRRKRRTK